MRSPEKADSASVGRPIIQLDPSAPLRSASRVHRYADEVPKAQERLEAIGALGLILVDATALERIERSYGVKAHRRASQDLALLVHDVCEECLENDFAVVAEPGSDEVLVFVYRPRSDDRFYREELPAMTTGIGQSLYRNIARICYPYQRGTVHLPVGHAFTIFNPTERTGKQIKRMREQAREESALNARIHERRLREQFHQVILAENLSSVYEPIVDARTREVMGYEALIRGPAGTELETPAAIFPMAEKTGLLFELDCLCRRKGLLGAKGLPRGKKLFLNCLPSAIHDPGFREDRLRETLDAIGLAPQDVVFEISEKESIDNFEVFREVRDYYHLLGFGIALDDVGAGYSGLETVMELQPDFIKLDLSLVRGIDSDPHRRELVSALNNVSGKLGTRVIGEGISTEEELETLADLGIPYAQGWLLGRTLCPASAGPSGAD
jgi:EAL domain-containing protein (putative c-di-GMP-specific phosphodiesterase class I)